MTFIQEVMGRRGCLPAAMMCGSSKGRSWSGPAQQETLIKAPRSRCPVTATPPHLVNLVYRPTSPEDASKENEFSRKSVEERWLAGYRNTVHALRHPEVLERAAGCDAGIFVFDFARG
jgi:Patatin phospholipase